MQNFLRFILLFIGTVYGAGELQILVDLPMELALPQETVIMNGDATVQDLVDVMNERLTDVRRKYDGIVFAGELKPTTSTLADSGISNGATVSLVKTSISDIELLFEMFYDPDYNEEVLGFRSYKTFEKWYPTFDEQRKWLKGVDQGRAANVIEDSISRNKIRCNFHGGRITEIVYRGRPSNPDDEVHSTSAINWDTINLMIKLKHLFLSHRGITGNIEFHKLPRSLEHMMFGGNYMSGVLDFYGCPAKLVKLDVRSNYFSDIHNTQCLPTMKSLCLDYNNFVTLPKVSDFPNGLTDDGKFWPHSGRNQ